MSAAQVSTSWWGGPGREENRLTILDLIRNETLDVETAALLWLLIDAKKSIVVAAAPQLAGKTTLLTALLDLVPPRYEKVFTRGLDEDFSWVSRTNPVDTYVFVPELSDHTPGYLWGDKLKRLFRELERGYSMGATMHADTPEQVLATLEGPPMFIHRELLANLHAVVTLRLDSDLVGVGRRGEMTRRLKQVSIQVPDRSPPLVTLVSRDTQTGALRHGDSSDARAALSELLRRRTSEVSSDLAHRAETFREWLDRGLLGAAEFLELLAQYHESA